jgi:hypothetical protein
VILDRLFFLYRKAGEEPGICLEVMWRGRGDHPWCECEDQRKSATPSFEPGSIRTKCNTCCKVKIGNRPNIRGKARADNCFLCKEVFTRILETPRRVECYCCERCCHHPGDANALVTCSSRQELETFTSCKSGDDIWIYSDCRYRIILVQAKHMYQSAKELDAANEEEDKGDDYDDDSDDNAEEEEEDEEEDSSDGDGKGGPASKKTSRKETALAIGAGEKDIA